jgi:hypothetical protein
VIFEYGAIDRYKQDMAGHEVMTVKRGVPGISRENRLSDDGLQRLERQLISGSQITDPVLTQWIRRYGDSAREIIRKYDRYRTGLEP